MHYYLTSNILSIVSYFIKTLKSVLHINNNNKNKDITDYE